MIQSVQLKNWKIFDKAEFNFKKGVNFIVAPNGSGKTSLLEAICVGLIGKVRTVENERNLVKDGQDEAQIILEFVSNTGEYYRIERKIPKEGNRSAYIYNSEGQVLERYWNSTNILIEELLGLESILIEKIVYASEGDVPKFIEAMTKEDFLKKHIETVLGIDKLEYFIKMLETIERKINSDIDVLRDRSKKFESILPEENLEDLERSNKRLAKEIKEIQNEIDQNTGKISADEVILSQKNKKVNEILSFKSRTQDSLNQDIPEDEIIEHSQKAIEHYRSELDELNSHIQGLRTQKDRIYGEINSSKKILDLISGVDTEQKKIKCPVCEKPLSTSEVNYIFSKTKENINQKNRETNKLDKEIRIKNQETETISKRLQNLQKLNIEAKTLLSIDRYETTQKLRERIMTLTENIKKKKSIKKELLDKKSEKEKKLRKNEIKIDRIKRISRLEPKKIDEDLVIKQKELYLSKILKDASQKIIDNQRERNLKGVYDEIAQNVKDFLLKVKNSGFSLDKITVDGYDRGYDQLSGGEKVAILNIIRTILCKYFSNVGFLLFDEPLEHLDQSNRRFLIDFLVNSCKEDSFQQFIVTTSEESAIRKYLDEEQVRIIMI